MIKIAYIINDLNYGGAQTMLVELLTKIDKNKIQPIVFVRESKLNNTIEKSLKKLNIECIYLDLKENEDKNKIKKIINKIKKYKKYEIEIKEFNPDIIHSHLEMFYTPLFCLINLKKLVITIHSQPYRLKNKHLCIMLKLLEKFNLLQIVGCAKCITDDFINLFHLSNNICHTIYNPIDLSKFNEKDKIENTKDRYFTYLHVGRLEKIKNQMLLLKSFSKVCQECKNSRLLIIGDGSMKKELVNYVDNHNLKDCVHFLGVKSNISDYMNISSAFVLSSDSEACPMTILEAMACGLPIISTNVGGISELIGNNGILVRKRNIDELSKAMIVMQREIDLKKLFIENNLKNVHRFDTSVISKEYLNLYEELLRSFK